MGKKELRDRNSYFGIVPNWLYDVDISLQAIATFGYIQGRYGGSKHGIFPKIDTLAKALKVSPRSIRNYLAELEKVRAIKATRRGFNKSNWYELASDGPLPQESNVNDEEDNGTFSLGSSDH